MMRAGSVFKRCSGCGAKVPDRRCEGCGQRLSTKDGRPVGYSWAYIVDTSAPGAPRKQRKRGGFATKREALEEMAEWQVDTKRGDAVVSSRLTVGEYLDKWLVTAKARLRPGAYDTCEVHVRVYVTPRIGDVRLQALTATDVKALYAELAESGRARGPGGLNAKTVHNVHVTLSRALRDADADRLIPRNPAERCHSAPESPEQPTWSADQLRTFYAHEAEDRWLPTWRLFASTGMRRGEVAGLRWPDLDLDAGTVRLATQYAKGGGKVSRQRLKGKRGRSVALDPATVAALKAWRKRQAAERLAWPGGWGNADDLVFTHEDGTPLHPDSITKLFKRRVKAAGLPWIKLHGLRHTWASLALEAGVPLKVVQERLGHSSIAITADVYSHVAPGMQADAAARVAALVDD